MRDTELYRHLLGLQTPWKVGRVELSAADGRVDVWMEQPARTRFGCPDCGAVVAVYDHTAERSWRHLDSCAFVTFLHARTPRVACLSTGCAMCGRRGGDCLQITNQDLQAVQGVLFCRQRSEGRQ